MSVTAKIRDESEYVVELVKAKDAAGQPFFAYILLQKSNLETFRKSLAHADTKLEKYGIILATGPGHNPSAKVWEEVQTKLKKSN